MFAEHQHRADASGGHGKSSCPGNTPLRLEITPVFANAAQPPKPATARSRRDAREGASPARRLCSPLLQAGAVPAGQRQDSRRPSRSRSPTLGIPVWPQRQRRMYQHKVELGTDTSRVLVRDAGAHLTHSSERWAAGAPLHIRSCRPNPYCSLYRLLHFPNLLTTEHLQSPTITCPGLLFSPRRSRLPSPPAAARSSADTRTAFATCAIMLKSDRHLTWSSAGLPFVCGTEKGFGESRAPMAPV